MIFLEAIRTVRMDKMGYMKELEILELRMEGTRDTWNYERKEQEILELRKEGTRETWNYERKEQEIFGTKKGRNKRYMKL